MKHRIIFGYVTQGHNGSLLYGHAFADLPDLEMDTITKLLAQHHKTLIRQGTTSVLSKELALTFFTVLR